MARVKIIAQKLLIKGNNIPLNEKLLVTVYNHIPNIEQGEKIRFPARLRAFKNFNNPGRYDYESAMKSKGFTCAASISNGKRIVPMGPGHLPFPIGPLKKVQQPIRDFFRKELSDQEFSLYRALILGERQGISHDLREPFNKTGLGHVLAVSGLHIGLVAWITFFVFKWILSRSYSLALKIDIRKLAALLTCIPVIGYTCLAGFQVSSQRAMIMALAFLWSLILGREKEVWSTLALAGLVILAIDTNALFGISFQLSFLAMIGILWLTPAFMNKIPDSIKTIQNKRTILDRFFVYFIGLIAVTLSATIFLLPVISFYFHRISLVTIPTNISVVPILGLWVLPLGLLSAVMLPISPQAAEIFLHAGAWGLNFIMEMIRFWSSFSWSSVWVITPNIFEIMIFYLLIFFIFFFSRWSWAKAGVLVITIFILADIGFWTHRVCFNKDLKVTFLDVGQGNSALVEFPDGKKMLIDGGGFSHDNFDVGKMVVAPFLWHSKIWRIDYLVLSHPQSDHMNGLRFIARFFHPKEFWYNGDKVETDSFKELMEIIRSKGIKELLPPDMVDDRQINGVKIEILHPKSGIYSLNHIKKSSKLNNNSLVLKITYKGKSFLFPGDVEYQGEKALISNKGHILKTDVLLSPHHGSKSSSSKEFLQIVQPSICVISSGEGNFFGFPHKKTLKKLRDIGSKIIRIDKTGAVQCIVGSKKFKITTYLKEKAPNL
jgi:competence protein ComEC